MSVMSKIRAERDASHARSLDEAWAAICERLSGSGASLTRFGSSERGRAKRHSDLDVMVMGEVDSSLRCEIERAVAAVSTSCDVVVDLLYSVDFTPHDLEAILAD